MLHELCPAQQLSRESQDILIFSQHLSNLLLLSGINQDFNFIQQEFKFIRQARLIILSAWNFFSKGIDFILFWQPCYDSFCV